MSKQLGAFDPDDRLDRPDLNKCPDCGCYFAFLDCPLCGKECPPEMRAGARVEPKVKKKKSGNSSGRVQFIPWYHSWWIILIALFVFPIAGIVLLATSPYQKKWKILFITLAVVVLVLEYTGLGSLLLVRMMNRRTSPVNQKLSRDAYEETCTPVDAEDFFHAPAGEGYYAMSLVVDGTVDTGLDFVYVDDPYGFGNNQRAVYLCHDSDDPTAYVFVFDYQVGSPIALKAGDRVTVWGQTRGESPVSVNTSAGTVTAPRLYAAYIELIP
ncbi:MAG: hypothetical protein MJ192_05960 [Clostridia bacterium]|nr:hypothetical protein [Clostridia bacterium]